MKVRNITEKAIVVSSVPPGVTTRFLGGESKELDGGFAYLADDPRFEVAEEKPVEGKSEKQKGGRVGKASEKGTEEGGGPTE